jgi:uncharacterized protein (DUF2141 family)
MASCDKFAVLEALEERRLLSLIGVGPQFPVVSYDSTGILAYHAATQELDIQATALTFKQSGSLPAKSITQSTGGFQIELLVDNAGNLIGGVPGNANDLSISGTIVERDGTIDASGVLLTGRIEQFGYLDTGTPTTNYDFRFAVTGGTLASLYAGKDLGIVLGSESSTFTGSFASDFGGRAKGNVGAVASLIPPSLPASLSGFVYNDANDNGSFDTAETGIAGSVVTLTGIDNLGQPVTLTATTDSTGAYSFANFNPGTYTVTESQPAGYLDGIDSIGTQGGVVGNDQFTNVVLVSGQNGLNNNFGELLPASIAGNVYLDANDNGAFDTTETGIAGTTVTLTGTDDLGQALGLTTATDNSGAYSFAGLRPGTYTLTESQPAGYLDGIDTIGTQGGVVSNDQFGGAVLASGQNGLNNNFGELLPASISGYSYADANNNGLLDVGESPIAGTTMTLSGADDLGQAVSLTTTTDSSGFYQFTSQRPGTYTVTETQPAGYFDGLDTQGNVASILGSNTTDLINGITVASGGAAVQNDFGELLPALVAGNVYYDANNNGLFDTTETGIAGATVTLTGTNDLGQAVSVATTTTGAGAYSFTNLRPGTYAVAETQPGGFLDGKDAIGTQGGLTSNDQFSNVLLSAGQSGVSNNFGELLPASVAGNVYYDANDNGVFDTTESGIAGATVTLTGTNDLGQAVSLTATTGSAGAYSFANLRPGTYAVAETQPASYLDGKDTVGTQGGVTSNDLFTGVALSAGQNGLSNNFGELLPASVAGNVYFDANNNGVFDTTETGIAGATVTLTGTNDLGQTVSLTTSTSSVGAYSFTNLRPGSYTLTETQPAGYTDGKDTIGTQGGMTGNDLFTGVVLAAGQSGLNNNFGEQKPPALSTISGVKYLDLTGNGLTSDDTPLGGMTIALYVDANHNGVLDSGDGVAISTTVTASGTGVYSFTGLATGTYFVQEQTPANYVRTAPTVATYYTIAATAGSVSTGNNFDNYHVCSCCQSSLTNVYYIIDGTTIVTDLRGNTKQGDQIQAVFTVIPGGQATVSLVTYTAPESTFVASDAYKQQIFDLQTGTFGPGTYTLTVQAPDSYYQVDFVCGLAIDHLGPANSNIFYSAQSRLISADNEGTQADTANPNSISGTVYADLNNDGVRQSAEQGIANVKVTLTGVDDKGQSVTLIRTTDANGQYSFRDLRAGTYAITEIQPANYLDGIDTAGSLGGTVGADKLSGIKLTGNSNGVNYNFGELQPTPLACGMTATIGFWNNKNGQALIKSLNGGCNSTALGNWLATTFPKLYGSQAGCGKSLAGKTNTQVAAAYQGLFNVSGQKLDAQVMAAALAVYVTDSDLAGTAAKSYGFVVSSSGAGAALFNVGSNGQAMGVANNTQMSVLNALQAVNTQASNGTLYNGSTSLRNLANSIFDGINSTGDIS